MNTDNVTISGETIDYGPCAFMEAYDPHAVFSSIDRDGRYAYGNQPLIAQWNLARFAEALLPLMVEGESQEAARPALAAATAVIEAFPALYQAALLRGQREKLGLADAGQQDATVDAALASDWLGLLHQHGVDFTLGWRRLADAAAGDDSLLQDLFREAPALGEWLARWRARWASEGEGAASAEARAERMRRANPWIIPRNHRVEEALEAASRDGDLAPFERLLSALRQPYAEEPQQAAYAEPAPAAVTACYQTFCGT
jgi:uncharacterized protein YdiU (UPF0061 family)